MNIDILQPKRLYYIVIFVCGAPWVNMLGFIIVSITSTNTFEIMPLEINNLAIGTRILNNRLL